MKCDMCGGTGYCLKCGGTGVRRGDSINTANAELERCAYCEDHGRCRRCHGMGDVGRQHPWGEIEAGVLTSGDVSRPRVHRYCRADSFSAGELMTINNGNSSTERRIR